MTVTISSLISTCPAPVSTSEGVSNSLIWFNLVHVFACKATDTVMPTRFRVADDSAMYADDTVLATTDYDTLNNRLMHIKFQLQAIKDYLDNQ